MFGGILLAASFAGLPGAAIKDAAEIRVAGRDIRLGEVATLMGGSPAERDRLAARTVARLPEGRRAMTLDRAALAGLVRRAVPGLHVTAGSGSVLVKSDAPKPVPAMRIQPPEPVAPDIDPGEALTLVSSVGPVRIQRKVIALQPGRDGRRVFVRDEDGQVLSVPLRIEGARP